MRVCACVKDGDGILVHMACVRVLRCRNRTHIVTWIVSNEGTADN